MSNDNAPGAGARVRGDASGDDGMSNDNAAERPSGNRRRQRGDDGMRDGKTLGSAVGGVAVRVEATA
jgi:hypothetical protein